MPLVNPVHQPTQSLLSHLYFAVPRLVSLTLKVIVAAAFLQVVLLLFALTLGCILSYVVLIVLDIVFGLPGPSLATHAATYEVVAHCAVGVILQLYVVPAHAKLLTVPLVTLTSPITKSLVLSLNVHVTTKYQFTYGPALLVNVTLDLVASILISFTDAKVA